MDRDDPRVFPRPDILTIRTQLWCGGSTGLPHMIVGLAMQFGLARLSVSSAENA